MDEAVRLQSRFGRQEEGQKGERATQWNAAMLFSMPLPIGTLSFSRGQGAGFRPLPSGVR
jgi:hypothetical protein